MQELNRYYPLGEIRDQFPIDPGTGKAGELHDPRLMRVISSGTDFSKSPVTFTAPGYRYFQKEFLSREPQPVTAGDRLITDTHPSGVYRYSPQGDCSRVRLW